MLNRKVLVLSNRRSVSTNVAGDIGYVVEVDIEGAKVEVSGRRKLSNWHFYSELATQVKATRLARKLYPEAPESDCKRFIYV